MLSCCVVIATRNRPEPVAKTLASLEQQERLPHRVIVVDSSDTDETELAATRLASEVETPIDYRRSSVRSAARQRNEGAELAVSDVVLFLDDDVDLDSRCLDEMMKVFEKDSDCRIGGVSATISNQVYSNPTGLNRLLLAVCVGQWRGSYAGKLIGPAVNFLPEDQPDTLQQTDWLPSTCTAYRRTVLLQHRFSEFEGYSFAEDVDISSRVGQSCTLVNNTRARVFHHDMGKGTHRDWRTLGKSMVMNRYQIMSRTMRRTGLANHLRLFWFEIVYSSAAWLAAGATRERLALLSELLRGKAAGFASLWIRL